MDRRIFELCKLLSENPGHTWTVEEMAARYDLSVPHFQKLFKHETGTPPIKWLHERRLEAVEKLLLNTHLPVKIIGIKTGLTNDSHLTRDFKKKFGLSPTDFRKHHAEIEQSQSPEWTEMILSAKK